MKNLRKLILPVAIVLMGAGAAFATNAAKASESTVKGYYADKNTGECIQTPQDCKESGSTVCSWMEGSTSHTLYKLNETDCVIQLFRP